MRPRIRRCCPSACPARIRDTFLRLCSPSPQSYHARKERAPEFSGAPRKEGLLVAVGNERGVEVVAGVVAAGGHQRGAGVNVAELAGLTLLLAGDFEILGAVVDGELDVL